MTDQTTLLQELLAQVNDMTDAPHEDHARRADARDGAVYRLDEDKKVAIKVALVTARPVLLVGPSGCGKSTLAPYVARNLGFRYLSYTVTEASEASDLLWRIDQVRRLNDAQLQRLSESLETYIERGVLWQAFQPRIEEGHDGPPPRGTVVLVDEIDKADSAFANSLLVAIGSQEFDVPPLNEHVKAPDDEVVLVFFTSNAEKPLPPAFLRRCVTVTVGFPSTEDLVAIAHQTWPTWMAESEFAESVSSLAVSLSRSADQVDIEPVSTAEFLDLVQYLRVAGVAPGDEAWRTVERLVLLRSLAEEGLQL